MTRRSEDSLRRWALGGFALVGALAFFTPVLGQGVGGQPVLSHDHVVDYGDSLFCLLMAASALLVLWFRPRHGVGWVLLLDGLVEGTCSFVQTYGARAVALPDEHLPLGRLALQLSGGLWVPAVFIPVTVLLLRYPVGEVRGLWSRRFDRVGWTGLALVWVAYSLSPAGVTDVAPTLTSVLTPPVVVGAVLGLVAAAAVLSTTAFAVVNTVVRTLRAGYPERQQLAWLVTVAPVSVALL